MLFNSIGFIFIFLPAVLVACNGVERLAGTPGTRIALLASSLFFYSWWDIRFLPILVASWIANYLFGLRLAASQPDPARAYRLLFLAILSNIVALGWFKYVGFITTSLNQVLDVSLPVATPLLPLGISFVTFHQITYLVFVYRTGEAERDVVKYGLFVTFFPQLLAGPITYAREMLPQFSREHFGRLRGIDLSVGLAVFVMGLFKKVVLADNVAPYADSIFSAVTRGVHPTFLEAWLGVFAFAFQIYFDFSGYSDMAIGLARMVGVRLPLNFHSPYKAAGIIEFWRRWHISLSRFLRDYLYIPLGGNRHGTTRRICNLMMTMLLGGLWHGAGWTFVIWGGLHGLYLVVNHLWRQIRPSVLNQHRLSWLGGPVTFIAVCVAWVFFRAENVAEAHTLLQAMAGRYGFAFPGELVGMAFPLKAELTKVGVTTSPAIAFPDGMTWLHIVSCSLIVWLVPNTQEIIGRCGTAIDSYGHLLIKGSRRLQWRPTVTWGIICALELATALMWFERPARFLYFQF